MFATLNHVGRALFLALWAGTFVLAQDEPRGVFQQRPYDGLQAGQDAYRLGEERRQQNIADQASLNDALSDWRNQAGSVVYYRPPGFNGYRYGGGALRADITYGNSWGGGVGGYGGYGYGDGYGASGGYQSHYFVSPIGPGAGYYQNGPTGGFYRPGYAIVVPSYPTPIRQPIGQWNGQTGPNRWESHPVYRDEDVIPVEEQETPPPPSAGSIVKPKIIVPPPREY